MKKLLIISIPLAIVTLFSALVFFFATNSGTLVIKTLPKDAKVIIDDKEYQNSGEVRAKVKAGEHKIRVTKDSYKDYEEKISVGRGRIVDKSVNLEITDEEKERQKASEASSVFISAFANYTYPDTANYLPGIKNLSTGGFYQYFSERYYLPGPAEIRQDEVKNYSKVAIKSVEVNFLSADSAGSVVEAEIEKLDVNIAPEVKKYQESFSLSLKKENGKWLIDWMEIE